MSEQPVEANEVLTAFFVTVDKDGTVGVFTNQLPTVTVTREASLADLETYGAQVAREAGRILDSHMIVRMLTPEPETTADRVSDALAKRAEEQ